MKYYELKVIEPKQTTLSSLLRGELLIDTAVAGRHKLIFQRNKLDVNVTIKARYDEHNAISLNLGHLSKDELRAYSAMFNDLAESID